MAKNVIMPALGMSQDTGTLIRWLKAPGESVAKGEPLMEIETDKATVEIEAPAAGVLADVTAEPGDVVPVGQTIALILAPGEAAPSNRKGGVTPSPSSDVIPPLRATPAPAVETPKAETPHRGVSPGPAPRIQASPLAARMAAEHGLDLEQIKPAGGKVQKEDVLAYLAAQQSMPPSPAAPPSAAEPSEPAAAVGRALASPKARRLAQERGLDIRMIAGTGPQGAVLAGDVLSPAAGRDAPATAVPSPRRLPEGAPEWRPPEEPPIGPTEWQAPNVSAAVEPASLAMGRTWRVMVERLSQAWATIPHFYLLREVNASRLSAWRAEAQDRASEKVTYTDLLIKVVASALRKHPRLNAAWQDDRIVLNQRINVGLAVAIDDGLVVPVIHDADTLGLGQIAARRAELVARAQAHKLSLDDLRGGTFTISNLGMYGVDAFIAIVNPPQAAILSAGRIAERVVPLNGQPAVAPMMTLGLSCDHRLVDGARAAQFLQALAELLEAPLSLLD